MLDGLGVVGIQLRTRRTPMCFYAGKGEAKMKLNPGCFYPKGWSNTHPHGPHGILQTNELACLCSITYHSGPPNISDTDSTPSKGGSVLRENIMDPQPGGMAG